MGAIRLDLIGRYLRPHRKVVLRGMAALVVVNLLSVSIPLLVRQVHSREGRRTQAVRSLEPPHHRP